MNEENLMAPRPCNGKELAALYGVNSRTLFKWLLPYQDHIGPRNGRIFTVLQVEIIFQLLGRPGVKKGP